MSLAVRRSERLRGSAARLAEEEFAIGVGEVVADVGEALVEVIGGEAGSERGEFVGGGEEFGGSERRLA